MAQSPVEMALFVDPDTLVLYVPGNLSVSLQGLTFEVASNGQRLSYSLANYPAFSSLYFDGIPTPICFRLQRDSTNRTLPLECQSIAVLTQQLSNADVFWYDGVANVTRTVLVMQGAANQGICPAGQSRCPLTYTPPTFTPTPITPPTATSTETPLPTLTPAYTPTPNGGGRGQIAFQSYRDGTGNSDIYVMNADGSNQRNMTNNLAEDAEPAWSPDGAQIAFYSHRDGGDTIGTSEIYVMNANGTNVRRLTNNTANDFSPSWSPDGTQIAFSSNRDGNRAIYVMNADGGNLRRLTVGASAHYPAWSPDGDSPQIAFASGAVLEEEIYVMNADGTNVRRLTDNDALDNVPVWSPDGAQIAFVSGEFPYVDVYVMNADGTNVRRLTNSGAINPTWSPDGAQIAFSSNRDGNYEIYIMNADGSNVRRLTNDPGDDYKPAWQP